MLNYIYRDMVSALRYLPYGLAIGIPFAAILLYTLNKIRKYKKKEPAAMLPVVFFSIYLAVMLVITFLSREGGISNGLDLKLFSTWGINDRNNAFVVENVLLFIPFGLFGAWAFGWMKRFLPCTFIGAGVSLGIECLQLVTGRGFFQIDDILTNILGTMIGFLAFKAVLGKRLK